MFSVLLLSANHRSSQFFQYKKEKLNLIFLKLVMKVCIFLLFTCVLTLSSKPTNLKNIGKINSWGTVLGSPFDLVLNGAVNMKQRINFSTGMQKVNSESFDHNLESSFNDASMLVRIVKGMKLESNKLFK